MKSLRMLWFDVIWLCRMGGGAGWASLGKLVQKLLGVEVVIPGNIRQRVEARHPAAHADHPVANKNRDGVWSLTKEFFNRYFGVNYLG